MDALPPESHDRAAPRTEEPDSTQFPVHSAAGVVEPAGAGVDPGVPGAGFVGAGQGLTDVGLIEQIEAEFPGWGVWRSDARRWWAFRTAAFPLTIDQLRAGCRLIVQADTGAQLRAAIRAEIESAGGAA